MLGGEVPPQLIEAGYRCIELNIGMDHSKENYFDYIKRVSNSYIDNTQKIPRLFPTTAIYLGTSYLPQVIGISIFKIFTKNVMLLIASGRIFSLITYSLLMYFSIKIIPTKKIYLFFIGLLPIAIQEACSYAVDGYIFAICTLFISYVLYLRSKSNEYLLTKKDKIILFILSAVISSTKFVYMIVVFSVLLLNKNNFKNKKSRLLFLISLILVSVCLNILSFVYAGVYKTELRPIVNTSEQTKYILENPFRYLFICFRSTNYWIEAIVGNIFGTSLGLLNVSVGSLYKFLSIVLFAIILVLDKDKVEYKEVKINNYVKIVFSIISIVVIGLVYTSEYVKWTGVRSNVIEGIQGRYFLPIFALIPFIFDSEKIKIKNGLDWKYIYLFMAFLNIQVINSYLYSGILYKF